MKRFLSAILVICLVFSLFPAQSAAGVDTEAAVENVEDSTVALVDGNESQEEESLPNPGSSAEADAPQNGEQQETGEAEEEIPEDFEMSPIVEELVKNGPANEGNWYLTDEFVNGRVIDVGDSGIAKPLLRSGNGGATVKSSNTGQNVTLYRGSQISYGSGGSTFKYTVDYSGGTGLICTCASPLKAAPSNWTWSNKTYKLDTSDAYYYVLKAAFATSPYGPAQLRQSFWSAASTAQNNTSYSYLHAIVGYLHENSTAHWSQQMRTNILGAGGLLEKITVYANSHHNELDAVNLYMIKLSTSYDANGHQMQDMMFVTYEYGTLYVTKTSSKPSISNGNSNYSLQNAKYGVYANSSCTKGTEVATLTTGSTGTTEPVTLLKGNYWVKELVAPKGFKLSSKVFGPVYVRTPGPDYNNWCAMPVTDDPITYKLNVLKTSSNTSVTSGNSNYSLSGAKYGIYKTQACTAGTEIATVTTDSTGKSNSITVPIGSYWAKELSAPKGYKLNPNKIGPINVVADGSGSSNGTYTFKASDDPTTFPIKLRKVSSNPSITENNESFSLSGAKYGVYKSSACTPGTEVGTLTTLWDGTSNALYVGYGTYYAKELVAPKGFKVNNEVIGPITPGTTPAVNGEYWFEATDEPDSTRVRILKKSSNPEITSDNPNYSLAGARYAIYDNPQGKHAIGYVTTGADGYSDELYVTHGEYYAKEISAPPGYELNSTMIGPIKADGTGSTDGLYTFEATDTPTLFPAQLKKVSADPSVTNGDSNYSLENAEYGVYSTQDCIPGTEIGILTTNANGVSNAINIGYGSYWAKELKAPKGFQLSDEVIGPITPGTSTAVNGVYWFEAEDEPSSARITIVKRSANPSTTDGNACYSLARAKYNLYSDAELTHLVGTFITRADGSSNVISDLEIGTYYLVEVEAPKGYQLDATPKEIVVDRPTVYTVDVVDEPLMDPVGILLQKVDGKTGGAPEQANKYSLAGAIYTIKYYDIVLDSDPAERGYTPERTWTFKTDESGFIEFTSEDYFVSGDPLYYNDGVPSIPVGTITIQETTPPEKYLLDDEVYVRIISPSGNPAESVYAQNVPVSTDDPVTYSVSVLKTSADTNITSGNTNYSLAGAQYGIYTSIDCTPGTEVGTVTTGEDGRSNSLEVYTGSYWAKEISAPPGYKLNETVIGPIDADGTGTSDGTYTFYATDDPTTFPIQLKKVSSKPAITDGASDFSLENAEYGVYTSQNCTPGTEVGILKTDANGISNTLIVGYGTYWAKELSAPEGFQLSDEVLGPLTPETSAAVNGVYLFEATDEPKTATLTIVKRSSNTDVTNNNASYSLARAKYNLYSDAELTNVVGTFTTRVDGTSNVIQGLELGTYYLVEVEAPKGFRLDQTPIEVTLDKPIVIEKEVEDEPLMDPVELLIQKVDGITNGMPEQGESRSLFGAQYTVKYYDALMDVDPGTRGLTPLRTWTFKTDENGVIKYDTSYLLYPRTSEPLYVDGDGNYGFPIGTITIQESFAPAGYMLDETVYVRKITPSNDPSESVYSQNVPVSKDYPSNIRIEIMKHADSGRQQEWQVFRAESPIESWDVLAGADYVGEAAKNYTPEKGATFQIYPSGMQWEEAPETRRDLVTTDSNGIAISKQLPADYYTVRQVGGSPFADMMFRPYETGDNSGTLNGETFVAVINNIPHDPPVTKTVDKTEVHQDNETVTYHIVAENNSEERWNNVCLTDILPADGDARGSHFNGPLQVESISAYVDTIEPSQQHFQRTVEIYSTSETVPDYVLENGEARDEYYDRYRFQFETGDQFGEAYFEPNYSVKAVGATADYVDPGEKLVLVIKVNIGYYAEGGKWVNDSNFDYVNEYGTTWSVPSNETTTVFPGRLELHKSVDKDLVERDGYFTYTITLKNVSTATLQNVRLYDVLPSKNNRLDSCTANSFAENLYIEPLPTNTENPRFDVYTFVESDEGEQDVGMVDEYLNNYQDISQDYDEVFHYFQPQTNYVHNQTEAYLDVSDEPLIAYTVEIPELKPGDGIVVTVDMNVDPHVARGGDYYVNQAHAFVYEQQASVVNSEIVRTEVVDREITGLVWYDQNHNGIQDDDEPRADGVYVQLVKEDGTYVSSLRTGQGIDLKTGREFGADTDGYTTDEYPDTYPSFCFYGVPAGEYRLEIDSEDYELESLGYMLTTQNSGDDRYDSDAHENAPFTLTSIDGIHMPTLDEMREQNIRFYGSYFNDTGYYGGVDFKFTKVDAKDMDVVLSGAKFELSNGEQTYTATSDRDGEVSFENIPEGTYELKEVKAPAGYLVPGGSWTVEIRAAGFLYGNYSNDDGFIKITANGDVPAFSSTSLQQGVFVGRDPLLRLQNNQIIDIPFTGASTALILQIVSFTFAAGALATVAVSRKKKRKSNAD